MRIGQHVLDELIAPVSFRISKAVQHTVAFRVFNQVVQVALLLVAKALAIRDEELKVACVRLIDVRIVDLIDNAMTQCEPETTAGMISRPDALLGARSPARRNSRRSERN